MKTAVLIAVVMTAVMCAVPAWSQGGRPGGPGGHGGPGGAMMCPPPPPAAAIDAITKEFTLSTSQSTSLEAILKTNDATI